MLPLLTSSVFKAHAKCISKRFIVLAPLLDFVSAVLLPPLLALFLGALLAGHGSINAESLGKVLDLMAEATLYPGGDAQIATDGHHGLTHRGHHLAHVAR